MSQPSKWWIGAIIPALVWLAASFTSTSAIEDDLHGKVRAGYGWLVPNVSGRDVSMSGTAPSSEAKTKAMDMVSAMTGVRRVKDGGTTVLAEAKPYRFEAIRSDKIMTLKGFYPDDATHAALLDSAKKSAANLQIADEMVLARGVPNGFLNAANFGLAQLGNLAAGNVLIEDEKYSISGVADNSAAYVAERAKAKSPPAGFSLASADITPPIQKPFVWSAAKDGNSVVLTGFIPTDEVRNRNVEAVKAAVPGASVVDKQFVASGAPVGFAAMASYGLGQLAKLSKGSISLEDVKYSITGEAGSQSILETSFAGTKTLPVGFTLGSATLSPPVQKPYTWSVSKDGSSVTLSGFVPNEAMRATLLESVKATFPTVAINDRLSLGAGEPEGLQSIMQFAITQLGKLASGRASISDKNYALMGEAESGEIADGAIANAKTLPQNFALASAAVTATKPIAPPEPPKLPPPAVTTPVPALPPSDARQVETCRKEFSSELAESAIYFDSGKDTFRQVSYAVLDRLVEIAQKCPNVNVEIAAHTDNDGSAASNQQLSERRALAVLTYLKARIDVGRYRAVGYGESKPIVPNTSDENKQKNRRVEFIVN